MYPTDRRYTNEHEWVLIDGDVATVGITDFAQKELGDIVFVELPDPGKSVKPGDVLGTIESVKAVSEIYAPLSGTVVEANRTLDARPETINQDPHGEGWYCKLRLSDVGEAAALLDADAYRGLVGT